MEYVIGLDIGSTTIKCVVLDENNQIVYKSYERHKARVREMAYEKILSLASTLKNSKIKLALSGSAAIGVANVANLTFVQEVFASAYTIRKHLPDSDLAIELGGEDAKIIFLKGALEERMNSSCAGGTGAFIDQMAALLDIDTEEFDKLSLQADQLYPVASRCGVFAKTDIQPLINQGARRENIAASVYQAVVDQTIAGLAQGRSLEGKVVFLGGPLTFLKGLRIRFKETLKLDDEHALFPENGEYYIALGAAYYAEDNAEALDYDELCQRLYQASIYKENLQTIDPLFVDEEEYQEFLRLHRINDVSYASLKGYDKEAYLGIDAGSTTTKLVVIDPQCNILYQNYVSSKGNPVNVIQKELIHIYEEAPNIQFKGSCVSGYGEELIKAGFHVDEGIVETQAHYQAAKFFNPDVDFILDIGGQDMKCFKIKDGAIDDIILNEACSSGCGSFLESFANSMSEDIATFAKKGLFAKHPVELGSRCSVFMNSSVKQAQKNGATLEDISAGLAMSIVKNALYKVIRIKNKDEIGQNIVVQGGTFLNDAILRCFERELNRSVIRTSIAELMGAFGAALHALKHKKEKSTLLSEEEVKNLLHTSTAFQCKGCTNHCNLTLNDFGNGTRQIGGNRCEKPISGKKQKEDLPNAYTYKNEALSAYFHREGKKGVIGIPRVLNMFEYLPFWATFFEKLGYGIEVSDESTKALYDKGARSIPSDTACYPAKLVHGHIESLQEKNVDMIFYPCMTYSIDEGISDNHFSCPVVAYYPELIQANMTLHVPMLSPYISLNDSKQFQKRIHEEFKKAGLNISKKEIKEASDAAYEEYHAYKKRLVDFGTKAIDFAKQNQKKIIVLVGRPYHIDSLIHHGISDLLQSLGLVVVSEDCLPYLPYESRKVLNQWTFHARMYNAARIAAQDKDMELIQLVSFGCGIDAITTDEIKSIMKEHDRLYTQIKIDETSNLGAVKIRIRSLLAALEDE